MQTIKVLRGLPGSGKSTYAKNLVLDENYVRFNRDDYRVAQFNRHGVLSREQEDLITAEIQRGVRLSLEKGFSVVLDNTTLKNSYIKEWDLIAQTLDLGFEVTTFGEDMTVDELYARVEERADLGGHHVPKNVIQDMYDRYTRKGKFAPYVRKDLVKETVSDVMRPYAPKAFTKKAIIADLDGTLALFDKTKHRGPYDEDERILLDVLAAPIAEIVEKFDRDGYQIIFMSARSEAARPFTQEWLGMHVDVSDYKLFMRAEGDKRKDSIVKYELFDKHIRDHYNIRLVLDDRDQVVKMWRRLGLTALQVADGNF